MSALREQLRFEVRMFYDLQRLRLQAGGRIQARATEIHLSDKDQERIAGIAEALNGLERAQLLTVNKLLKAFPIWDGFLKGVKGIGPTMGGVILAEYDISIAENVSKMWRFGGLAVNSDGTAEKRKKGEKLAYNSFLKSKLLGVLGPSFLKCSSPYRDFYDNYKHRLISKEWGKSDGHRHNASIRYMVKMFIKDLYVEWRTIEGLTVRPPYAEEYLGKVHATAEE
ncbi:hypothetical protein LCGC14_0394480 [marine sediment metagenome]|uniref:Uncharacterized protein n=1 Tax=marine sediment metagenome TaxID=412755 RepID=A0A0F9W7S8_9ZZZZ